MKILMQDIKNRPLCRSGIGQKFAMRRKLLRKVRYSWEELPTVDKNLYHAKYHDNEAYMHRRALKQGIKLTGSLAFCPDCAMGKSKRRVMKKISSYVRSKRQFGRVYADCTGPFKTRAVKGYRYVLMLVDDFSRRKFIYLMKDKSKESVLLAFKLFQNEHVLPLGTAIGIIRTDNGTEFVNSTVVDWMCEQQIVREYTSDYSPHLNAVAETGIRDMKNLGVTLMNAANLKSTHKSLWGDACINAVSLLNDSPTSGNPGYQSPNEMCGIKSLPLALRFQFGSRAFVVDENSQLFENRVHECLFLGYEKNKPQNCLRFYKLSNGSRISSTNFSVIDGMMMFNEDAVRFDDILVTEDDDDPEGDGADFPTSEGSVPHASDFAADDSLALSDDEWDGCVHTGTGIPVDVSADAYADTGSAHAPTPIPPPNAVIETLDAHIAQAQLDGDRTLVDQLNQLRAESTLDEAAVHFDAPEDDARFEDDVNDGDADAYDAFQGHGSPRTGFRPSLTPVDESSGFSDFEMDDEHLDRDLSLAESDMIEIGSIREEHPSSRDAEASADFARKHYMKDMKLPDPPSGSTRSGFKRAVGYSIHDVYHSSATAQDLMLRIFICADGTIRLPATYAEALRHPAAHQWLEAMKLEFSCLLKHHTWDLVDPPTGVKIVGSRWVLTVKFGADGTITRYKARFVVQGFSQTKGVDYFETFAPVVSLTTVRMVIALAATNHWPLTQMDVETAFLNALVSEDIYVRQAPGFIDPLHPNRVCKLRRSLYGICQAPRNFNLQITQVMLDLGLTQSVHDPCLFYYVCDGLIAIVCIYVDDLLFTGNHAVALAHIKKTLSEQFVMKDLGVAHHLLGLTITCEHGGYKLAQGGYIRRMLEEFDVSDIRARSTPADEDMYLQNIIAAFDGDTRTLAFDYRSAVGCMMFLSNSTRPDISNAVRFLSGFVTNYTDVHIVCAKKVLKYLEGSADLGLMFCSDGGQLAGYTGSFSKDDLVDLKAAFKYTEKLQAFSDASWADNYADATSTSGVVIQYDGCLILWKSIKQKVAAQSSMESEYIAMSKCVTEIEFCINIFKELSAFVGPALLVSDCDEAKNNIEEAVKCWTDNIAAICVGNATAATRRSRHINREFHNVKDAIRDRKLVFDYIQTDFNKADIGTKNLGPLKHKAGIKMLGMC
jgi:transposase InsO family protein